VPYPDPYRLETGGQDAGEFVLDLLRDELFKRHLSPQDVAAVFVEPLQLAFYKGLLLACGESVIRIAPPLVVDEYDVDTGLQILEECLSELTRVAGRKGHRHDA
jgi:4-aminobutyrate aminotransferase-like enzyme